MNKEDYLIELKSDIDTLLGEYKLNNYKSQAFAWKLNARFNRTFDEKYLWNRALFLATNSCILLQNNRDKKTAIKGLYESAEIYEYLSELPEVSDIYDKDYLVVLSALCYDLSGYQANAFCVANKAGEYELQTSDSDINLDVDNSIIEQIRLILLKKIPLAYNKLNSENLEQDSGYSLFKKGIEEWYQYVLKLNENDYLASIEHIYNYYLHSNNTYLSHLLFLLKTRIKLFDERSLWKNVSTNEEIENSLQWRKYAKLLAYDYYSNNSIKEIEQRKSIFELWTSQIRAIEQGLIEKDENFVIQMPTSAGKTFIAELSILKYLIKHPNKKCIYVAPFRALTNEKEEELSKYFSKIGFSVSSLSGSYEIDEFQDVILSDSDLLIATPEKIDLLLRINPDFFEAVSFVVVDEGHIIGDISTRATLLEFLIIRLRIKIPELKTLFISAVMPPENADEYSLWLSGTQNNVLRSLKFSDSQTNEEWEPTRKLISYFEWGGNRGDITFQNVETEDEETKEKQGAKLYSYLQHREFGNKYPTKKVKKETAACLAYKLSEEGNTLVFCAQVPRIKSVATSFLLLLEKIEEIPDRFKVDTDKKSSYYSQIWYGEDSYITQSIDRGIGIHYGDMPEQVRTAVEDDFRKGNLKVLLSTNTIGQGLNFPIKNLIFYETQIGRRNGRNIYIQYRDFWNIVGRAGRAGKETEGKIIFIINSSTDRRLYNNFIDKGNIEDADSFVYKVLDALVDDRINSDEFSEYLSILSETYLLDLLTEEIIGTEYEKVIEEIINNSLFKVQIDKRQLDITPLSKGFNRIFKSFEENTTFEQLSIYRITGFSFKSNKIIDDFIDENIDELKIVADDDNYYEVIRYFLKLISDFEIEEMEDYKLDNLDINPTEYYGIIESWVNGSTIKDIISQWEESFDKDVTDLHIFISKALYYLYPWGFSSFLLILSYRLNIEYKDLPENTRSLSSYIKYGLNSSTSCLARSLGIKSRQVSLFLFEQSNRLEGNNFIKWISNLTNEEIESFDISIFDKENLKDVSLKLTPNSYRTPISDFHFRIKGTYFSNDWSKNSMDVQIGDELNYLREEQNQFDPYAILIMKNGNALGYIPREYSKLIASEIDIEDSNYSIIIDDITEKENYNEIYVQMNKIE
ncbi:MAG: DEAD/DEAH box helicase [Bacteroidales bacterium]|nr:DEAD/DEAH box helicase [Bacteroidales bacterium]